MKNNYSNFRAALEAKSKQELLNLLDQIYKKHPEVAKVIYDLAISSILEFDFKTTIIEVVNTLEKLPLDELMSYPRGTSWDYIDRSEAASDIIDRELRPFTKKVMSLLDLEAVEQARIYQQAILKAIYRFETKSDTEFKSYLDDHMYQNFTYSIDQFLELSNSDDENQKFQQFIKEEFGDWV